MDAYNPALAHFASSFTRTEKDEDDEHGAMRRFQEDIAQFIPGLAHESASQILQIFLENIVYHAILHVMLGNLRFSPVFNMHVTFDSEDRINHMVTAERINDYVGHTYCDSWLTIPMGPDYTAAEREAVRQLKQDLQKIERHSNLPGYAKPSQISFTMSR